MAKTTSNKLVVTIERQEARRPLVLDHVAALKFIRSQKDYEDASKILSEVKRNAKNIKTEKDRVLAPLLEATKAERSRWKAIEDALETAEASLKAKLLDWVNELERKRAAIEADKRITKSDTLVAKVASVAPPSAPEVSIRKVQQLVIVDEALIPRQYLVVDHVKIRQALLSGQEVPGAELKLVNSLAAF